MPVPLYQTKAEFFRTLGHPVRIRVLELLGDGPLPVRDLLADIDIEASNLSQQLAVLRRAGIVTSTREGGTVRYALAGPDVAELMRAARSFLTQILTGQAELLHALRDQPASRNPQPATRDARGMSRPRPGAPRRTPGSPRPGGGSPTRSRARGLMVWRSANTMAPAQRTAWDTYLTVTRGLLPALYDDHVDVAALNTQLGGVAARILRYAPLRGEHGPMLVSAVQSGVRLHRAGNRDDLANLLRAMANRLYVISAEPGLPRRDGHDRRTQNPNRRNAWRAPTAPPHGTSAPERDQP